jgi:glycosyltransferase involved in cell wall biosynthesis
MIRRQTYPEILEWIIVEGSPHPTLAEQNGIFLKQFIHQVAYQTTIPTIKYIPYSGKKLGGLRNLSNDHSKGQIMVCFDDDDYYPPERIEHAVKRLQNSHAEIAGVTNIYIYDFQYGEKLNLRLFQFCGFSMNHSTNNAMAYKREYLSYHRYDENATYAEETSFTDGFTAPMVQLNPHKTVITISHFENTVCKKQFCNDSHPYVKEKQNRNILQIIPFEIYQSMLRIYCGGGFAAKNETNYSKIK